MTFLPELCNDIMQGKVILLAFIKQLDSRLALSGMELHPVHDGVGCRNLITGHLSVGLGDMPHHREGGREKCCLYAFLLAGAVAGLTIAEFYSPVEVAAQCGTENRAQRPAKHVTQSAAEYCSPPGHQETVRASGANPHPAGHVFSLFIFFKNSLPGSLFKVRHGAGDIP